MFKVKQRAQSMVQSLLMIDKMELEGDDSDGMYWQAPQPNCIKLNADTRVNTGDDEASYDRVL